MSRPLLPPDGPLPATSPEDLARLDRWIRVCAVTTTVLVGLLVIINVGRVFL